MPKRICEVEASGSLYSSYSFCYIDARSVGAGFVCHVQYRRDKDDFDRWLGSL